MARMATERQSSASGAFLGEYSVCKAAGIRRILDDSDKQGRKMQTSLQDRQGIADLMTGWIHRDLAEWEKLRDLFHPDGAIEITWFEGLASDFVDGSMRMGKSDLAPSTSLPRQW